jgi:aminoglycoside/choline kinase family phosphotransferase
MSRLRRSLAARDFLTRNGMEEARRVHLQGDASSRAYETVGMEGRPVTILMNSPRMPDGPPIRDGKPYSQIAHLAESVAPFVAIAEALRANGVASPEILAQDLEAGFLLIEHLGSGGFLEGGAPVPERYAAAAALLAAMHGRDWPTGLPLGEGLYRLPAYDREAMLIEVQLMADWYIPFMTGAPLSDSDRQDFLDGWNSVLDGLSDARPTIVLRDYHSPNLIWRPDRSGTDRLGVIDFQDALHGPAAYDVASLAQDARVTIPEELERQTLEAYVAGRAGQPGFDSAGFRNDYAIMAAQRNSKILGIFVRLDRRDGKPHYLAHLPRIRDYLGRALAYEALAPLREVYARFGLEAGK